MDQETKIVWVGSHSMHVRGGQFEEEFKNSCRNYVEAVAKIALWKEEGSTAWIEEENGLIYAICRRNSSLRNFFG